MHGQFGGGLSRFKLVGERAKEQARPVSADADSPDREREPFTKPSGRLPEAFLLAARRAQSLHAETQGSVPRRQPYRVAKGCHGGGTPYYATRHRPTEVLG